MDAKKKQFALTSLRRGSMKWKPRNAAKNKNRKKFPVEIRSKKGTYTREVWHYNCSQCGPDVWYRDKDIQMDHVNPVVDEVLGWQGFDVFIDRLLVEESGWQRLCEKHHEEKSAAETVIRTISRKSRKKKNSS